MKEIPQNDIYLRYKHDHLLRHVSCLYLHYLQSDTLKGVLLLTPAIINLSRWYRKSRRSVRFDSAGSKAPVICIYPGYWRSCGTMRNRSIRLFHCITRSIHLCSIIRWYPALSFFRPFNGWSSENEILIQHPFVETEFVSRQKHFSLSSLVEITDVSRSYRVSGRF